MGYKKIIYLMLLIVLTGLLGGCGTGDRGQADGHELVIGIGRDFYNGAESSNFVHGSTCVWESLTYLDENLEPTLQLAERLVSDTTASVWTVYLRQGVKFHDGTPLDADAVVKSIKRLKEHVEFDEYGTFVNLEKVESVGEREIKCTFNKPEPAFPAKVAYHGCPIFSLQSFDDDGKITFPHGTGPFKFAEYKNGEALVVTRNDEYWGDKPKLDRVIFKIIPDPSTRLAALQAGEIQAVADVGGILPEQVPVIEGDDELNLFSCPVTTTHYLLFNNQKPPFYDARLRQAVSLSLDRRQLVREVLNGYGEPADTIFTPQARAWTVGGLWTIDKNKAQELVAQVNANTQRQVVFVVNSALANRWPYKPIAEILQSDLKTFGFEVELKMLEMGAWKEAVEKGEYDLTLTPYTLMTGDPDFFFDSLIHSKGLMNMQRGIGYSSLEADRLVEVAAAEREPAKRQQYYSELQQLVAQDMPLCPVYHDVCLYATAKNVHNLKLDPFFKPELDKAWIEKSN
ncbi:ABC transporter substrate-binding protein [Desulfoscipio gibsoniae]|uniref:ABC-type dipeptide transport system, periplasmic component n=1 Tax=Desulfoscipio gibsoniae DSM 7213 TaxID=767817 RepID=R4KIL0_9FIRM|nr:ABC transporter substrate-binding protein [Desulfoscipio gibsoniae]AGL00380.1 ABC-type dipeptide transport system, periplasmic component [Desulfoscipio gibsoniae DSM 7213]